MRPKYCDGCGYQLWRCASCYAWRCGCGTIAHMYRHYEESGVPMRHPEPEPYQRELPALWPVE